jgi:hypothetical protein
MAFLKNGEQEGKAGLIGGWKGGNIRKGHRKVTVVEILCSYI